MSTSRRDPRRPYVITIEGFRRITLSAWGETGPGTSAAYAIPAAAGTRSSSGAHSTPAATKGLRTSESPRSYLLVLAQSERGVLDEHQRQTVAAAALLANPQTAVVVAVLGDLNEDLAACGADIVIVLPDCDSRTFRPEYTLARVATLLQRYRPLHVLLPDRAGEGDLGRRLAAAQGASIATHVVELAADHLARYDGSSRLLARRALTDIVLLAPEVADTRLPFAGTGQRVEGPSEAEHRSAYRDAGLQRLEAADLPLEEADLIAAAGNGVSDVALFQRLAKALGAATGASRVAVDDGRFAREKQIGATGKTVSANLYLAIGISGAVQHLQGIKDCRHVIAINRDIAAPMIQRANLSVIGDAQAVMQALLEAVEPARSENGATTAVSAAKASSRERAA
jgi:N,N-dimethylglycine/sarcosine catabolism electron transfer flavoprotein subunit alpha